MPKDKTVESVFRFDSAVFFGFPLEVEDLETIRKLAPHVRNAFIQNQDSLYLQFVRFDRVLYLGKYLDRESTLESLESTKKNIFTIAENLGKHLFLNREPVLFPVPFPPDPGFFPDTFDA